jgi:hypothetical protein
MAKFLAYKRDDRQVVTVNTIDVAVENLGNTIVGADLLSDFAGRTENIVAQFRGDYYLLYRTAANEVRLSILDIGLGMWSDVVGFTPITPGTGSVIPLGLHVVKDRLVAICTRTNSAGVDGVIARRSSSDDGATWSATTSQTFMTQPTNSRAGASVVWHNAVFYTTAEGIGYYDPAGNAISALFDAGSDAAIIDQKANFGSFSFLGGDLYYVLPTDNPVGAPTLYKLDKAWSVSVPLTLPAWTKLTVVIPGIGEIIVNNDTGNYSLFVNRAGVLSVAYSGALGSKLVTIQATGSSFTVTDVSDTLLPSYIRLEPNLGFSYYVDDRRRGNEKHTIIVRFKPSIPQSINLLSWDGVTEVTQIGVLDNGGLGLDLMVPDVERGDFRTYTANEPSCFIDDVSQPFPGRVRLDYTVRDASSRPVDVIPEYSLDGQTWFEMSEGDGDDGKEDLATSAVGLSYFFFWDAFVDLDGDYDHLDVRVIARIAGV